MQWHVKHYDEVHRQPREAAIYRHLEQLGCRFVPHYGGVVEDTIDGRKARIERMSPSLDRMQGTRRKQADYSSCCDDDLESDQEPWRARLTPRPFKTLTRFWEFAYELALAMWWLHDVAGVCHRDLKPDNLCYDPESLSRGDPRLAVIDFEFAEHIGQRPRRQRAWCQFKGTSEFVPPEMACDQAKTRRLRDAGLPYDERCDVWSYGVTLLMLYSGVDYDSTANCDLTQFEVRRRIWSLVRARKLALRTGVTDAAETSDWDMMRVHDFLCRLMQRRWRRRPHFRDIVVADVFEEQISEERRRELRSYYWRG